MKRRLFRNHFIKPIRELGKPSASSSTQLTYICFHLNNVCLDSFRRNYTNKILDFARQNGYVETLAGRRRYLPHINSTTDIPNRSKSERQAINTKIQGSAADIAKYAMLRMERNLSKYQERIKINVPNEPATHVQLVLHLHDELIYEIPADRTSNVGKILKSSMENCAQLNVPLKVKMKSGKSWGTMKPI